MMTEGKGELIAAPSSHARRQQRPYRRKFGMSYSAPNRSPVSPAVCSVYPGKILQLSTTIGIAKMESIISDYQQQQVMMAHMASEAPPAPPLSNRIRLKSGRLQPLGLCVEPELSAEACLGIVSVDKKKKRRNPTAPATRTSHFDFYQMSHVHRRVLSATPTDIKLHSTSLVTRPAVAQGDQRTEVHLPHMTDQEQQTIKVELTGATKQSPKNKNSDEIKLPNLTPHSAETDPASSRSTEPLEAIQCHHPNLQLYSLPSNKDKIMMKRRRRKSGSTEARLSKGWTNPVPIEAIRGSNVSSRSLYKSGSVPVEGELAVKQQQQPLREDTPSVMNIDVDQVLKQSELDDNT